MQTELKLYLVVRQNVRLEETRRFGSPTRLHVTNLDWLQGKIMKFMIKLKLYVSAS